MKVTRGLVEIDNDELANLREKAQLYDWIAARWGWTILEARKALGLPLEEERRWIRQSWVE